jgi:hypothetical protein
MVDEATCADLEDYARRDGGPTLRLIREAMERYLAEREREVSPQPLPDFVGALKGGGGSIAGKTKGIIAEAMDEVYRTEVRGEPKTEAR